MSKTHSYLPQRIVCLTEETTETLYLLGEQARIVGISGFTVRPKIARKEKPKVSTFLDAKLEEIITLEPDLVIGFSDIQANIAQALIARGITVWVNNHRSVEGIFQMMVQLGSLVGKMEEALELVQKIQQDIQSLQTQVEQYTTRPKVYFEEWYDPLISGIRWVSELVELAGGVDIFPEKAAASLAKDRIIADPQEVIARNPDIILASWCGKKFKKDRLLQRPGWDTIQAVQNDEIYEIHSSIILQPGPASVAEGVHILAGIVQGWQERRFKKSPHSV